MIYGANQVMPLAVSSWTGNFTKAVSPTAKTHMIDKLTFNTNGTFVGSGTYRILSLPNTITQNHETYTGTYAINNDVITAQGDTYFTNAYQGTFTFSFSFDTTHQHMTSGTWTDTWDNNLQYDILPETGSPYVSIINRICGQ
jgi:hypothetical protein